MRSECKEVFLREAARLEYSTYWDEKNDRPEAALLQCHWSWFQVAWNYRQAEVDEYKTWVEQLQRERNFLQKKCAERADVIDELQKRINDSIFILSTIDNPDEAYKSIDFLLTALRGEVKELEQALKGGSDASN